MILKSEIESRDINDYERLFELCIDSEFKDFVKDKYSSIPLSMIISYNEDLENGMATIKFNKIGKTVLGSSESMNFKITKDNFLL